MDSTDRPLEYEYDAVNDVLVVEGVRYHGDFFRVLAYPYTDSVYSFETKDGVVTVTEHGSKSEVLKDVTQPALKYPSAPVGDSTPPVSEHSKEGKE